MSKSYVTEEYVRAWLYKFRTYTPTKIEHKRALIDTFVHAVYLYDDKMLIVFNCKGEKRSITFDDINGADISKCGEPEKGHPIGCPFCFVSLEKTTGFCNQSE